MQSCSTHPALHVVAQRLHHVNAVQEAYSPVAPVDLKTVDPTSDAPPSETAILVHLQDRQHGVSDRWSHTMSVLSTHGCRMTPAPSRQPSRADKILAGQGKLCWLARLHCEQGAVQ